MAYPQKLLAAGETIKFETKPHWRGLLVPAVVLIVTVFVGAVILSWIVSTIPGWEFLRWIVLGGAVLVLALWAVVPFLRWLTTEYVFTDRRIIVRQGIISRSGRDMPMAKVNDVSFEVSPMGRVLNYGALVVQSAGENSGLTIRDVPDVEDIQRMVYELIEKDEQRRMGHGDQLPPNSTI